MDNELKAELDEMLTAPGMKRYGQLMAAKFGGDVAEFGPYLLAVALEVSYLAVDTSLKSIEPDNVFSLIMARMRNDSMQPLVIAAGEAVGIDWKTREAEVLEGEQVAGDDVLDAEVLDEQ